MIQTPCSHDEIYLLGKWPRICRAWKERYGYRDGDEVYSAMCCSCMSEVEGKFEDYMMTSRRIVRTGPGWEISYPVYRRE